MCTQMRTPMRTGLWFVLLSLLAACRTPPLHTAAEVADPPNDTSERRPFEPEDDVDPEAVGDGDEDGDRIRYACDRCPEEREIYNGILDADGCPDTSGTAHAVFDHATNRFGWAIDVIEFPLGQAVPGAGTIQRVRMAASGGRFDLAGAETIACVGQADPTETNAGVLATSRAQATCGLLQQLGVASGVTWSEVSVGVGNITTETYPSDLPTPRGALVVTRADGIDLWRLVGGRFERATPARTLSYDPPLSVECELD